jgi:hypothetical protein
MHSDIHTYIHVHRLKKQCAVIESNLTRSGQMLSQLEETLASSHEEHERALQSLIERAGMYVCMYVCMRVCVYGVFMCI